MNSADEISLFIYRVVVGLIVAFAAEISLGFSRRFGPGFSAVAAKRRAASGALTLIAMSLVCGGVMFIMPKLLENNNLVVGVSQVVGGLVSFYMFLAFFFWRLSKKGE
jgi:hypothetical protein